VESAVENVFFKGSARKKSQKNGGRGRDFFHVGAEPSQQRGRYAQLTKREMFVTARNRCSEGANEGVAPRQAEGKMGT